jgi:hypothetical protein
LSADAQFLSRPGGPKIGRRFEEHAMVRMTMRLACVLLGAAAGCSGPTVTVRHYFRPAVEAPPPPRVAAGEMSVDGLDGERLARHARAEVQAGLDRVQPEYAYLFPRRSPGAPSHLVEGRFRIEVRDDRGSRRVREAGGAETLPTLVREIDVRAVFSLPEAGGGSAEPMAEVRRGYVSTADPRVRGEDGLGRPDDPPRVPPAEQVAREMIDECVAVFLRMIKPPLIVEEVALRPTLDADGAAVLADAERGDFGPELVRRARAAAAAHPGATELAWNAAVLAEKAGELESALTHYERVAGRSSDDKEAAAAVERVKRVIERKQLGDS